MNVAIHFCILIIKIFLFELIVINPIHCKPIQSQQQNDQILVVVSYDAFKNDYLKRNITPNLLEFRRSGVYADHIVNVFPTKTFTNHHSIATGLYPEVHGVTANEVYDTDLGYIKYGYELFHYNNEILPIWALNEKNGGSSGCMMWPGSNFEYKNITCTYTQAYNTSVTMKDRIDTVISWLKNPTKRPNLIMIYFEIADKIGHAYGPDSQQVNDVVKELDKITKYLQDELERNNFLNLTNVVHLSDHGMEGVSSSNFINLTMFLEPGTAAFYGTSPVFQVVPIQGKEDNVYTRLKNAAADNGHFSVYKVETLPERWHVRNKKRFGPIIALAELGYAFQDMYESADFYKKTYNIDFTPKTKYGVHGYDNALIEMHPIFMAKGPLFKENTKVQPFSTTDLFNLFCKILKIDNVPSSNGSYDVVRELLRNDADKTSSKVGTLTIIGICLVIALIVAAIFYAFVRHRTRRRNFYVSS